MKVNNTAEPKKVTQRIEWEDDKTSPTRTAKADFNLNRKTAGSSNTRQTTNVLALQYKKLVCNDIHKTCHTAVLNGQDWPKMSQVIDMYLKLWNGLVEILAEFKNRRDGCIGRTNDAKYWFDFLDENESLVLLAQYRVRLKTMEFQRAKSNNIVAHSVPEAARIERTTATTFSAKVDDTFRFADGYRKRNVSNKKRLVSHFDNRKIRSLDRQSYFVTHIEWIWRLPAIRGKWREMGLNGVYLSARNILLRSHVVLKVECMTYFPTNYEHHFYILCNI